MFLSRRKDVVMWQVQKTKFSNCIYFLVLQVNDEFKTHAATLVNDEEKTDEEGDESDTTTDDQQGNHDQGPLPSSDTEEETAQVTHLGKLTMKLYVICSTHNCGIKSGSSISKRHYNIVSVWSLS